jgi:pimeloyl-ACP methyl ester carboxylesterase
MPLEAFGDVFGERWGPNPPRVLGFHGWGRTRSDLAAALGDLPAIAVDLPGFGASPPPAVPTGADGYAIAVAHLLDEVAEPAILVGHSFGGRVAVALAVARPERVAALVLTGVPLLRSTAARTRPAWRFRAARTLHRLRLIPDRRMEALRRRSGSADYRAAEGVMRDVLVTVVNESYEHHLAMIDAPVTLLWGGEDTTVPVDVARQAAEILPRARLEVVADAGHDLHIDRPDALRDAVREVMGSAS